jgi:1-acyl-sn-glycerol-3-phosphate acyltransferase
MPVLRASRRVVLITVHVLLGILLTPLVARRHADGCLRTNPRVTAWWHNRLADILGVGITVAGPRPEAPALLASNHVSWLDIVVLGGLTETGFLSKYEIRRWPVVGWLAARSGTLFIRRGSGEARRVSDDIAARLRDDSLVTLFPEGTTTDGRQVRPFFSRLFGAALDTRTRVVPVALRYHVHGEHDGVAPYTDDQTLVQNLRGLLTREKSQVHVTFGTPITIDDHSRKQVAEIARATIIDALQQPIAALPAPAGMATGPG